LDLFPCNLAMSYEDIERLTVNEKVSTVLCANLFTQVSLKQAQNARFH